MRPWGNIRAPSHKWRIRAASDDLVAPDGKTAARVTGYSRTSWKVELADGRVTQCRDRWQARAEAERLTLGKRAAG